MTNIPVIIIFISAALVAVLIVLFALYIYREKRREGITYERAIAMINDHSKAQYPDMKRGAKKKFCEDMEIENHKTLIQAINPNNPLEAPKLVAETLNKMGYPVVFVNKSMYLRK